MEWLLTKIQQLGDFGLGRVLPGIIILVIGILIIRIILQIIRKALQKTSWEKASHNLILSVVRIALYLLLGLVVAAKLGIDVTGIVALASVLTLAISLSLQNALANLIGGFTIMSTDPFESGHFVEIAGQSGTVKEIGLSYTKLATTDNKIVSIPNSAVVAAEIVNYTVTGTRRLDINLAVSYGVDPESVMQIMQQAAKQPEVLNTPAPVFAMKEYNEQNITYGMMVWCNSADYWTLKFNINLELSRLAKEAGIRFYDPQMKVHLEK
jgi:small conductance mechanosensitive channel